MSGTGNGHSNCIVVTGLCFVRCRAYLNLAIYVGVWICILERRVVIIVGVGIYGVRIFSINRIAVIVELVA